VHGRVVELLVDLFADLGGTETMQFNAMVAQFPGTIGELVATCKASTR
jgi:hypothetical protein